nr:MAG TPA: hypothetical protein [Caudoviricetes sp.]
MDSYRLYEEHVTEVFLLSIYLSVTCVFKRLSKFYKP